MCYYSSQRKRQMLYNNRRKGVKANSKMPQTWFLNKLITWGKECKQTLVTLLDITVLFGVSLRTDYNNFWEKETWVPIWGNKYINTLIDKVNPFMSNEAAKGLIFIMEINLWCHVFVRLISWMPWRL
jgi:hypothetical protein